MQEKNVRVSHGVNFTLQSRLIEESRNAEAASIHPLFNQGHGPGKVTLIRGARICLLRLSMILYLQPLDTTLTTSSLKVKR